ncbi:MAG TPA: hypothetical protein VF662_07070 [Allosphingosinicella sp.]
MSRSGHGEEDRRAAIKMLATFAAAGAGALGLFASRAAAAPTEVVPNAARDLRELMDAMARAPRRRSFKTVPMILRDKNLWDHEALSAVLAYRPPHKQVWDNKDIAGPWLNSMRNALNNQIWSYRHPDFLAVSMTHGTAQLALYDEAAWAKYKLADRTGGAFRSNSLILDQKAASADPDDFEAADGVFSLHNNTIPALVRRGVVFGACHNAVWELASALLQDGVNPDKLTQEALAADLTNHLIADAVITPGAVGTLPELQHVGFHYAT